MTPIGIQVMSLSYVGKPEYPPTVIDSINAKVTANQKTLQREQEVKQREAEANMLRAEVAGQADAIRTKAQAEADAIRLRGEAAPEPRCYGAGSHQQVERYTAAIHDQRCQHTIYSG